MISKQTKVFTNDINCYIETSNGETTITLQIRPECVNISTDEKNQYIMFKDKDGFLSQLLEAITIHI